MSYLQDRELAALRQELRDHLSAQDAAAAAPALARLRDLVGDDEELRAEYERWVFRFDLVGAAA